MTTTAPERLDGVHYRDALAFASLELREDADTGKREIAGIAVPYDTDARIRDWFGEYIERFERGAVQDSDDALLYWRHSEPIGKLTASRDTDAGWEITATISTTPRGDEAYQLVKDGVIREFSIGFQPIDHREVVEDETEVVIRTKVKVREVSLVPFGAFGQDAPVSQVREASTPNKEGVPVNDTINRADLDEVRTSIDELDRKVALIPTRSSEPVGDQFRSLGDMVKQIAAGDENAKRAYEGAVSGETALKDAWFNKLREKFAARQTVVNTFSRGTLPAEGMNVDVVTEDTDTTQAGVQTAEGDDLLFGKVTFKPGSTPVKTIGGWSSQSRQAIERSSLPVVDRTFRALVRRVFAAEEAYARSVLDAAYADATATALDTVTADFTTQDGIVAGVLDLAEHFENAEAQLDGIFVDKATFLAMYAVTATDRVLQINGAPTDKVGSITVETASGNVADLTFRLLPNATAGTKLAYDSEALETLASPGLPFRLQDDNIVNLTRDMSAYGYVAAYTPFRAGLVKIVTE